MKQIVWDSPIGIAAHCWLLLYCLSGVASADEAAWKDLTAKAAAAAQAGKLDEAEQAGQQAAEQANSTFEPTDARIGDAWSTLGMIQFRMQKFEPSAASFQKAVDAFASSSQPGDIKRQNARYNLSQAQFKSGKFDESFASISSALHEAEKRVGANDHALVAILKEMAGQAVSAKKPAEAIAAAERALQIESSVSGQDSSGTLAALEFQGNIFSILQRPGDALIPWERALAIRGKLSRRCDFEVIRTLDNLQRAYGQTGQPEKSRELLEDAIARSEIKHGAESPVVRPLLRAKADLLTKPQDEGELHKLQERLQKLDEIAKWQEQFVAAQRLRGQGKVAEAGSALAEAVEAGKAHGESGLVAAMLATEQGELAFANKRMNEAEAHFARALELNERVFGTDHVAIATSLTSLGVIRGQLGQAVESLACFERGLAAYRAAPSTDNELLHNLLVLLGMGYYKVQRHAEAEPVLLELVQLRRQIRPAEEVKTAEFWNYLGVACQAQGKLKDAKTSFDVAATLLGRNVPPDNALRQQVANNAAIVQKQLDQAVAAEASKVITSDAPLAVKVAMTTLPHVSPDSSIAKTTARSDQLADPNASVRNAASWTTGGVIAGVLGLFVAITAGRRGFNSLTWFVTFCIFGNPIILLALLAILPNRKLDKLRAKERKRLAEQLAQRKAAVTVASPATTVVNGNSLGDQKTSQVN